MKALILLFLLLISGCGEKTDMATIDDIGNTIVTEIKGHMLELGGFTEKDFAGNTLPSYQVTRFNDQDFKMPIKYDKEHIDDAVSFTKGDDSSDMVVVLRAKSDQAVSQIENYAKALRDEQYKKWQTGDADQFEKVQQNITKTFGRYVVYVTHDAPQRIADAIEKEISKKA